MRKKNSPILARKLKTYMKKFLSCVKIFFGRALRLKLKREIFYFIDEGWRESGCQENTKLIAKMYFIKIISHYLFEIFLAGNVVFSYFLNLLNWSRSNVIYFYGNCVVRKQFKLDQIRTENSCIGPLIPIAKSLSPLPTSLIFCLILSFIYPLFHAMVLSLIARQNFLIFLLLNNFSLYIYL